LAASVAASVAALLAIWAAATIWVRSTPQRLVAECKAAQESAAKAETLAGKLVVEIASLRSAWLVQQQDIEKYLESIDSRARRVSAVKSQEKRREAGEAEEDGAPTDPEGLIAVIRAQSGF
jgi:hypothetical protein